MPKRSAQTLCRSTMLSRHKCARILNYVSSSFSDFICLIAAVSGVLMSAFIANFSNSSVSLGETFPLGPLAPTAYVGSSLVMSKYKRENS